LTIFTHSQPKLPRGYIDFCGPPIKGGWGVKVIVKWPLAKVFSLGVIENWSLLKIGVNRAKTGGFTQYKKEMIPGDPGETFTLPFEGQKRPPRDW
jgi:hypothetical protein